MRPIVSKKVAFVNMAEHEGPDSECRYYTIICARECFYYTALFDTPEFRNQIQHVMFIVAGVNISKFAGLSRDWVGAKILFMCVFFGSFLNNMGEKNT